MKNEQAATVDQEMQAAIAEYVQNGVYVSPPIPIERYAQIQGLTVSTVEAHIKRGYIPTVKVGRYRMVNMAQLTAQCLEQQ